jgi:hypothetical protein
MRSLSQLVTLLLVLIGVGAMRPARAEGTFIPAASRVDFTHDAYRNIIYIANGTQILRYSLNTDAFLTPFVLPRIAGQLDISPDGQALAVATRPSTNNTAIQSTTFTLINLQTGEIRTPSIYADGDYGIVSLAFDNAGQIFVVPFSSSGNAGSMRRYNLATDTSAWPGNRYISRPLLKASPERDIIGIAERSSSGGQWAYFDLPNGQFLFPPNNISNGTGQFNYAIGLTGNGAQFALPTYGGVSIYNKAGTLLTKLGQYPGVTGMGLAYHPTQPVMYIPWAGTSEMRVFDTNSFAQIGSYNFETLFDSQGTASFAKGHTRVSDDGTVLMASVDNGVRFLRLSAPTTPPLRALGSTVAVNEDSSLTVQLKAAGGLPTHGPSYEVVVAPKNGTLSAPITSQLQTYTPNPNFNGTDQFQFRATQNGQSSLAWVYITVNPVNDAPVATAPANPSRVRSGGSVRMPYGTATDIDSTSLRWRIVRAPQHGTAEEDFGGGAFIYRASADFVGVDTFDAVVNDGTTAWGNTPATPGLDSNVVTYTVNVIRNAAPVAVNDTYYNVPRYGVYQVPAPGVLANDYDPDGDAITASSVEYVSWGYAWISPDGTLNWEPWYTSHLWDSTITITYYVRDELGYGNKAVVTLSIGQRATANAQSVSTPEDTAKSITLTGGGEPGLIYSIVSQPANGTVTGVLPNVVYTPNSNWNGSDEFTFAVDASNGTRAIAKVTVDVTPSTMRRVLTSPRQL